MKVNLMKSSKSFSNNQGQEMPYIQGRFLFQRAVLNKSQPLILNQSAHYVAWALEAIYHSKNIIQTQIRLGISKKRCHGEEIKCITRSRM